MVRPRDRNDWGSRNSAVCITATTELCSSQHLIGTCQRICPPNLPAEPAKTVEDGILRLAVGACISETNLTRAQRFRLFSSWANPPERTRPTAILAIVGGPHYASGCPCHETLDR